MAIAVTTLGTGSPIPDPNRAGSAILVEAGGTRLLVDAGRGVLMRLAAVGVLPTMLDAVLITHLHSDHITDLNDVVTTHWVMSGDPNAALRVYGPAGTRAVVDAILAMLDPDISYRIAHHDDLTDGPNVEVHELIGPCDLQIGAAAIAVRATEHRPVEPSIGYRITCEGTTAAIAGDTVPCEGLDQLCADADIYVQTVIRDDLVRLIPNPRLQDILDYHSTIEQAGATAARNNVGTLVGTHFVPPLNPTAADAWRELAARHFTGTIVLADDLTRIEAPSA